MIFYRMIFAAFCLLPFSWAQADGGVTLFMDFYYGSIKAADTQTVLTLSDGGNTYHLSSHSAAVGLAKLLYGDSTSSSSGTVDDEYGLLMTLYSQQRGKREPQQAIYEASQLHLQRGAEQRTETVTGPLFDSLSLTYRSYILGRPVEGKAQYTNGWRLTEYEYQIAGMETVDTGMGDMEAVLLIRHSERGDRKIWLAPALNYLPVRLYVNDKGHEFTSVLQSVER